jgi:hypothetical protein
MDHGIFSQNSMVITPLVVDDHVLVQLALTKNPCSNIVDFGSDRKIFGDLCSHLCQRPPTLESWSSALAARTNRADSNDPALLKFDMKPVNFLDCRADWNLAMADWFRLYRVDSFQAKPTSTNRNSRVSKS